MRCHAARADEGQIDVARLFRHLLNGIAARIHITTVISSGPVFRACCGRGQYGRFVATDCDQTKVLYWRGQRGIR